MGTSLTGVNISSSYLGLLKTTDSAVIGGTAKIITDGNGNDSPLYLSTTALGIGGTPDSNFKLTTSDQSWIKQGLLVGGTNGVRTSGSSLVIDGGGDSSVNLRFILNSTGYATSDGGQIGFANDGMLFLRSYETTGSNYGVNLQTSGGSTILFAEGTNKNVGINTLNPLTKLHIQDNDVSVTPSSSQYLAVENNGNTAIGIFSSTTGQGSIDFGDSGDTNAGRILYEHNDNNLSFSTNGSQKMSILSDGKIGIGTSTVSSSAFMEIKGVGSLSTAIVKLMPSDASSTTALYNAFDGGDNAMSQYGTVSGDTILQHIASSGELKLRVNGTTGLTMNQSQNIKLDAYGGGTITGTATQRLGVDSSGNVIEIPIGAGAVDGSGTAGRLAKWTDSDTLGNSGISDSSNALAITINGNEEVGIGVSPLSVLHIGKPSGSTNLRIESGTASSVTGTSTITMISRNASSGTSPSIKIESIFEDSNDSALAFHTTDAGTTAEKMRLDSSGRLGIGLTPTTVNLEVKSIQDSSFDEGIGVVRSNSSQTGYINMVGGAMNINAPNAIPIKFRDGGNTNLEIGGDGVVSINTGSLRLDGTAKLYTNNDDLTISADDNGNGSDGRIMFRTVNLERMRIDGSGNIQFTGEINSATVLSMNTADGSDNKLLAIAGGGANSDGRGARIRLYGNEHTSSGVVDIATGNIAGSFMTLSATDNIQFSSGGSERMRLDSSGNLLVGKTSAGGGTVGVEARAVGQLFATRDGDYVCRLNRKTSDGDVIEIRKDNTTVGVIGTQNWGIGTASPSAPLSIQTSSTSQTIRLIGRSADGSSYIQFRNNADSSNYAEIGSDNNSVLLFNTNGSEAMRLDSSGRLGLGLTNPSDFDADANNLVVGSLSGNNGITIASGPNAGNYGSIYFADGTGTTAEKAGFIRYEQNTSEMTFGINAVEKLGIALDGTATFAGDVEVTGTLTIDGDGSSNAEITSSTASSIVSLNVGGFTGTPSLARDVRFFTNSASGSRTERMRLDSSGNVGISTDSPDGKLDVAGNVYLANYPGTGENQTILAQNDFGQMRAGIRSGIPYIGSITSLDFALYTGNTERARLDSSGRLGLGTSNPSYKLDIEQSAENKIRVLATGNTSSGLILQSKAGATVVGTSEIENTNVGNLLFKTGTTSATERMRISSDGSLQAQADSGLPLQLTSVVSGGSELRMRQSRGTIASPTNSSANGDGNYLTSYVYASSAYASIGHIGIITGSATNDGEIQFSTASGGTVSERARITSTGEFKGPILYEMKNNAGDQSGATSPRIYSPAGGTFAISCNNSERLRITSVGDLLVGKTSTTFSSAGTEIINHGQGNFTRDGSFAIALNRLSSDGEIQQFYRQTVQVGNISVTGSATTYNTSSDYRLKEDLQDFNALEIASKIKMYDFKWKENDSRSYGVMAHELEEVLPQAVSGEKDAEEMQSVDYSKLVPILLKSIQELKAEIDELKKNK